MRPYRCMYSIALDDESEFNAVKLDSCSNSKRFFNTE